MSPEQRAAIEAAVDEFDVTAWAPLDDRERDLISRGLARPDADRNIPAVPAA